jgi:hypothetical protein
MSNEHGELGLEVKALPGADSEDLAGLTQRLRAKLLAHDGDAVDP